MRAKLLFHFAALVVLVVVAVDARTGVADTSFTEMLANGVDFLTTITEPLELFAFVLKFVQDITDSGSGPSESKDSAALLKITDTLNELSEDIQDFRDELFQELKRRQSEYQSTAKLDKFFEIKERIDDYFEAFMNHHNDSVVGSYLPSTKDKLVTQIRAVGYNGVTGLLQEMHALVGSERWSLSSLNLLSDDTLLSTLVCSRGRPAQLIIYNIFLTLCATEIKGLALDVYAISVSMKKERVKNPAEFNDIKQAYVRRLTKTMKAVRGAMKRASRSYWSCEQDKPEEGTNFVKFGRFLKMYIDREENLEQVYKTDTGAMNWNKCKGGCSRHDYSITRVPPHLGGCEHRVRNCRTFDHHINICFAKPNETYRYTYVETIDGQVYGYNAERCVEKEKIWKQSSTTDLLYTCELCLCTCEEPQVHDHFIDLSAVRANAKENEVIVGLRFRMKLGLLFIEAKVAQLLPSGKIDPETQIWKRKKFTSKDAKRSVNGVNHLQLGWANRSFVLDDVELDNDYVLTGVKFVYDKGFIKLAARGHKYNFKRGRIQPKKEIWTVSGQSKERSHYSEFSVGDRDLPTEHREKKVDSYGAQFVNLTTSGMRSDVGQSVVPFVEVTPVVTKQLIPLAGLGLIHKGSKKSAGYLALKLIGYDFEPHVRISTN